MHFDANYNIILSVILIKLKVTHMAIFSVLY